MKPKTIALLVVAVLFVIILILNSESTKIKLFFWPIEMPLFVLIVSSIFLGWVVGWFTHLAYFKGKYKRESAKKATKVEKTTGKEDMEKKEADNKEPSADSEKQN